MCRLMNEDIHFPDPSDELDLHNFKPSDASELIDEFIWSCKESGFHTGAIIHGKGTGSLRELTHSRLKNNKLVKTFQIAGSGNIGNWGKTTFQLID